MQLLNLTAQKFDIGRYAIIGCPYWDGTSDLFNALNADRFQHRGTTEGEVAPESNPGFSVLTLPEHTGPAPVQAYVAGEASTLNFGVYPTPEALRFFSPTGSASAGTSYSRPVRPLTIWLAPERLFLKADPTTGISSRVEVTCVAGAWTKDGQSFDAEDQRLFNLSTFFWKMYSSRLEPVMKFEDGGKSLAEVTLNEMHDFSKPEGHQLRTRGVDLAASTILLNGSGGS